MNSYDWYLKVSCSSQLMTSPSFSSKEEKEREGRLFSMSTLYWQWCIILSITEISGRNHCKIACEQERVIYLALFYIWLIWLIYIRFSCLSILGTTILNILVVTEWGRSVRFHSPRTFFNITSSWFTIVFGGSWIFAYFLFMPYDSINSRIPITTESTGFCRGVYIFLFTIIVFRHPNVCAVTPLMRTRLARSMERSKLFGKFPWTIHLFSETDSFLEAN